MANSNHTLYIFPTLKRRNFAIDELLESDRGAVLNRESFITINEFEDDFLKELIGDQKEASLEVRLIILQKILAQSGKNWFQKLNLHSSFKNRLLELFDMFSTGLVTASNLEKIDGYAKNKDAQIRAIYKEYKDSISASGYVERVDLLSKLTRLIKNDGWLNYNFKCHQYDQLEFIDLYKFVPYRFEIIRVIGLKKRVSINVPLPDARRKAFGHLVHNILKFENLAGTEGKLEIISSGEESNSDPLEFVRDNIFSIPSASLRNESVVKLARERVKILSCQSRYREIEEIANLILDRIDSEEDIRFSDFAIVFRNPKKYISIIESVFDRYGISYSLEKRLALSATPVGLALISILDLAINGISADRLTRVLKSPYFKVFRKIKINIIAKHLSTLNLLTDSYVDLSAAIITIQKGCKSRREKNEVRNVIIFLQKLNRLSKADSLGLFLDRLTKLINYLKLEEYEREGSKLEEKIKLRDSLSISKLFELLENLRKIASSAKATKSLIGFKQLVESVILLADHLLIESSSKSYARDRVNILPVYQFIGSNVKNLIVAGMHEGEFPDSRFQGSILTSSEMDQFNDIHYKEILSSNQKLKLGRKVFEPLVDRWQEESYLFYLTLRVALESVTITYSKQELDGKLLSRSHFIDELLDTLYLSSESDLKQSHTTVAEPINIDKPVAKLRSDDEKVSKLIYEIYNDKQQVDLKARLATLLADIDLNKAALERLNRYLRIINIERNRDRFFKSLYSGEQLAGTVYDGNLTNSSDRIQTYIVNRLGKRYSPTMLETYGQCPYKFFASKILSITLLDDPVLEITDQNRGSLIHESLERFYRQLIDENNLPLVSAKESDYQKLLLESYNATAAKYRRDAKLGAKVIFEAFKDRDIYYLKQWLANEIKDSVKNNYRPVAVEQKFELQSHLSRANPDSKVDPPYKLMVGGSEERFIVGIVDRIDINKEGGSIRALDYKNSKNRTIYSPKVDSANFGITSFQLPIYLLFADKFVADRKLLSDVQNVNGCYQLLRASGKSNMVQIKGDGDLMSYLYGKNFKGQSEFELRLSSLISDLELGRFNIVPTSCDYCEYKKLCRINVEGRMLSGNG
ncbi:MAG: PD-(D/E)XK nuclease family protein [Nitrospinota bacterium]